MRPIQDTTHCSIWTRATIRSCWRQRKQRRGRRLNAPRNVREQEENAVMKNQAMSRLTAACLAIMVLLTNGCSVKQYAVNKLGDSLAKSGTNYASDNDPELVGAALPFSLKLIEGLLEESPKHQGLLFAASSGFTQYSYVYVQEQADELEATDIARATE